VSEPNLAYSSLAAESRHSDGKSPLDAEAIGAAVGAIVEATAPQGIERLQQYLDTWAAEHPEIKAIDPEFIATLTHQATAALEAQRQQWAQEQEALRAQLRQVLSLSHEQGERIRHLEQALDQSLASLDEMQLQVVNQHLLEAQLASTEEISNIQQQAIARLKLQLAQQQQALTAQLTETQARDRALQTLLNTMEALTQAQQQELTQLHAQIIHDRADVEAYQQRLEAQLEYLHADLTAQQKRTLALEPQSPQSLEARSLPKPLAARSEPAHAQVSELLQILSDRQIALKHLEAELQQAQLALQEQQALLDRLQQSRLPRLSAVGGIAPATVVLEHSASAIAAELLTAQAKIAALEAQAAKQNTAQAMLRHACQELEEERDRQQTRMAELESQTTDMQEQILRQAQQASEYETAIQHWKNRCFSTQSDVLKLQSLLEHALPNPPAELLDLLAALLAAAETTEPSSPALLKTTTFSHEPKVDLPDFLLRRRNHKTRRS
jgi:chromosome segregation ATPase